MSVGMPKGVSMEILGLEPYVLIKVSDVKDLEDGSQDISLDIHAGGGMDKDQSIALVQLALRAMRDGEGVEVDGGE